MKDYFYLNLKSYIYYVALAYAFILPLSRAGITFFTGILLILWVFDNNKYISWEKFLTNKLLIAWGVFILFNLFSLLWSDAPIAALDYIRRYWYILPMFVFYMSIPKKNIPHILSAFILGMFVSELIAYGIFFNLWTWNNCVPQNPSPFMHHIEYSIFLAFTALVLLNRILNDGNFKYKLMYSIFFTTVTGNLFLTAGRTGQFAFFIGLLTLVLISFTNKLKALLIFLIISISILFIAYHTSNTFHQRLLIGIDNISHLLSNHDYCTSWGGRVGAWILSKDIIAHSPILGAGIIDNMKQFHQLIDTRYVSMQCMHESFMHVHNQYFQVLTQLGFVGLGFLIYIFYTLVKLPLKRGEYYNIKYIYISILLFSCISEVVLHRQFSLALFALIVGILLVESRSNNAL